MEEHKSPSQEKSVEQNLTKDYIPKDKVGNLPMANQLDETVKKKMEKTQKEIQKFKEEIFKKVKNI